MWASIPCIAEIYFATTLLRLTRLSLQGIISATPTLGKIMKTPLLCIFLCYCKYSSHIHHVCTLFYCSWFLFLPVSSLCCMYHHYIHSKVYQQSGYQNLAQNNPLPHTYDNHTQVNLIFYHLFSKKHSNYLNWAWDNTKTIPFWEQALKCLHRH